jgi:predicted TIM-barrel fold metal-dependent hydrolase
VGRIEKRRRFMGAIQFPSTTFDYISDLVAARYYLIYSGTDGIVWCGTYERLLFGTDWSLSPLHSYRDFVQRMIPEKHQKGVFHDNSVKLFKL